MTPDVVAADPTCKLLSAEADTEKAPTATRPPNTIFFIMIEADTLQESLSNFFFVASVVKRAAGVASLDEHSTVLSAEVFSFELPKRWSKFCDRTIARRVHHPRRPRRPRWER